MMAPRLRRNPRFISLRGDGSCIKSSALGQRNCVSRAIRMTSHTRLTASTAWLHWWHDVLVICHMCQFWQYRLYLLYDSIMCYNCEACHVISVSDMHGWMPNARCVIFIILWIYFRLWMSQKTNPIRFQSFVEPPSQKFFSFQIVSLGIISM